MGPALARDNDHSQWYSNLGLILRLIRYSESSASEDLSSRTPHDTSRGLIIARPTRHF